MPNGALNLGHKGSGKDWLATGGVGGARLSIGSSPFRTSVSSATHPICAVVSYIAARTPPGVDHASLEEDLDVCFPPP